MRLDLHVHSTASDGACAPGAVIERAVTGRLDVVALADHDTTSGVREAVLAARDLPIEVVPALEVSSTWEGHDIHVLGYFVDPESPTIEAYAARARRRRADRMLEMLERLAGLGIHLELDDVLAAAGEDVESLARPHLAQALVDAGHVPTVPDAFRSFLADDGPAFVPTRVQDPGAAVELIEEAGGLSVWAHPPPDRVDPLLPELVEAGLDGLEVFRPRHHPNFMATLRDAARRHDLVMTGGSDWHAPDRGAELGDFYVTADEVSDFLAAGGM